MNYKFTMLLLPRLLGVSQSIVMETSNKLYLSCSLFSNTSNGERNENIVVNIRVTFAMFSLIGSLFVLFLIWLFKKYKFFTQRLILYISITALISAMAYILGRIAYHPHNEHTENFCKFSGFLLLYSDWTVLLATVSITINLLLQVACHINTERLELVYVAIMFIFPLLIVWIPFTKDDFGPSGAWCWIQSQNYDCTEQESGRILQFTLWYLPLYGLISVMFLIYIFIICRVKDQVGKWYGFFDPHSHRQRQLLKDEITPLLWYPVIYLCVQFFPFLNRIVINTTQTAYFSLFLLHVSTSPLTGMLIAVAYALDRDTMRRLNWRSIKMNMFHRRTDQIVRPYMAANNSYEEEPIIEQHSLHHNSLIIDSDPDNN